MWVFRGSTALLAFVKNAPSPYNAPTRPVALTGVMCGCVQHRELGLHRGWIEALWESRLPARPGQSGGPSHTSTPRQNTCLCHIDHESSRALLT
jgi:hypothetical protein